MERPSSSDPWQRTPAGDPAIQRQLQLRREQLQSAIAHGADAPALERLVREVDAALERIHRGTFGVCETCHDAIEGERLAVDPLLRHCLDHLSESERRSLEADLDLAVRVQHALLPKTDLRIHGWDIAYKYAPAGSVSGDYCDVIVPDHDPDSFYFFLGDVTGKGVAASLLMSQLHAIFRSLVSTRLPIAELLRNANRIFCEGTLSTHFATLVGGKSRPDGGVEIVNAGHCFPLHLRNHGVHQVKSTGLPLGMFCESTYSPDRLTLDSGEALVIYSDGVSEARNPSNDMLGEERLSALLSGKHTFPAQGIAHLVVDQTSTFRAGAPQTDDLTVLVLKREA